MRRRLVVPLLALALSAHPGAAAPPDEAILPVDRYTSGKARSLGEAYAPALRRFHEQLYHCLPWVDVPRHGMGFMRPRWASGDERYFSVWIWIDQDEDPGFAALPPERRASAMLSRYGVALLRRMAALPGLAAEERLDGFGVILSWIKPGTRGRPGQNPVNETLALFADRQSTLAFLARGQGGGEFAGRARHAFFDGEEHRGPLALEIWPDSFVDTYRLQDYRPPQGVSC